MRNFKLLFSLLCVISFNVLSDDYVRGTKTTITQVTTYQYGSAAGHVMIKVADVVAGCESGYFITAGTPGLEEALSSALSAFHSGSLVLIDGRKGVPWIATNRTDYCQVHGVSLVK